MTPELKVEPAIINQCERCPAASGDGKRVC